MSEENKVKLSLVGTGMEDKENEIETAKTIPVEDSDEWLMLQPAGALTVEQKSRKNKLKRQIKAQQAHIQKPARIGDMDNLRADLANSMNEFAAGFGGDVLAIEARLDHINNHSAGVLHKIMVLEKIIVKNNLATQDELNEMFEEQVIEYNNLVAELNEKKATENQDAIKEETAERDSLRESSINPIGK